MAYNGAGVFNLYTPGNPVVTGTVISSSWANNTLSDIATGLSTAVTKNGQTVVTANIPMAGFKITGLGAGTATGDAVNYTQLTASGGAGLTGFIQSGTGAVATTVQTKERQIFSAFDFMTAAQIADAIAYTLAQDCTTALQTAWTAATARSAGLFLPAGAYLVSDTAITITSTQTGAFLYGIPQRSRLDNRAGANKPTIKLFGAEHWDIRGLVLTGQATFPNEGIRAIVDGSANRVAFGTIDDVICCTNGVGIHLSDTNTIWIDNYVYWPSGLAYGGTKDANANVNAILADGTTAVNSVYVSRGNLSANIPTIANGGAAIKWATTSSGSNDIQIVACELEGITAATSRAIDFSNVLGFGISGCFCENTSFRFLKSRYGDISCWGGSTLNITVGDTTAPNACVYMDFHNIAGNVLSVDSTNSYINERQCTWATTHTNSAANKGILGVVGPAANVDDAFSTAGIVTTPTYSGGNFTSDVGSWTVGSGDVVTYAWTVINKVMTIWFHLDTTTVAGTPAYLALAIPGGYTVSKRVFQEIAVKNNSATATQGLAAVFATEAIVHFYTSINIGAWANSTDASGVYGFISFPIT